MNIFVFGSNLQGRHGKGAALHAKLHYGAKNGVAEGLTGSAYALPTKNTPYKNMSFEELSVHAEKFVIFSKQRQDLTFLLTKIGCGLAGFNEKEVSKLFNSCLDNVLLVDEKENVISKANKWADAFNTHSQKLKI